MLKKTSSFGMQGQLSNLVQLLNYRLDSYLVLVLVSARPPRTLVYAGSLL